MYERFAAVYDRLMGDVPYGRFAALFYQSVAYTGVQPNRLIDLGCGTGAMFEYFLAKARTVLGVDPSVEMLAIAAEKAYAHGQRISLLQGRAADFRAPKPADWCVAVCDVMNYLLSQSELVSSFRAVWRSLAPGGYFLFDLHSPHKLVRVIGDNTYCDVSDATAALMKTTVAADELVVTYELSLFSKEKDGRYTRADERHIQKAFTLAEVIEGLGKAGFGDAHVGVDFAFDWDKKDSITMNVKGTGGTSIQIHCCPSMQVLAGAERWFFLCRKPQ